NRGNGGGGESTLAAPLRRTSRQQRTNSCTFHGACRIAGGASHSSPVPGAPKRRYPATRARTYRESPRLCGEHRGHGAPAAAGSGRGVARAVGQSLLLSDLSGNAPGDRGQTALRIGKRPVGYSCAPASAGRNIAAAHLVS